MCDHCGCRTFVPVAELTAEHEEILLKAWDFAKATRLGHRRDPTAVSALLELLELHFAKEETGLYPALRQALSLTDDQSAELEAEHRALRLAITKGSFDRRDFYALAAHIENEEMQLFPAAMLSLDEDEWTAIEEAHCTVKAAPALMSRAQV